MQSVCRRFALKMEAQREIDEELLEACTRYNVSEVQRLLLIGGDPCHVSKEQGWTALHCAAGCDGDDTAMLNSIIASGNVRNINDRTMKGNVTPLLYACLSGNVHCCEILLKNGADVAAKNVYGDGVIHYAALSTKTLIVEKCLKWNGVNVNQPGVNGYTPLMEVCAHGYVDTVRVLLSAGADVDLIDDLGNNAEHYARMSKNKTEILKLLQSHKSNPQLKKATMPTTDVLPTALGTLSISPSDDVNKTQNVLSLKSVVKRVFPKFDDSKMNIILATIERVGINFEDYNPEDLLFLKESDFTGDDLKPLEVRKLLHAFQEEYGTKNNKFLNF